MARIETIALRWIDDRLLLLDQRLLPHKEIWIQCTSYIEVTDAIKKMIVRGAPIIGITGAFGMVLACRNYIESQPAPNISLLEFLQQAASSLIRARPTAVNLTWAVERMLKCAKRNEGINSFDLYFALEQEAIKIYEEDLMANVAISQYGAQLLPKETRVLTHCNAGALAVSNLGTALGIIKTAFKQGKVKHVWIDETRPFLQGTRLSAWELHKEGIPYTIIVDGAAAWAMRQRLIDVVIVGADRIAANGDTANKIGTYMLAICAKKHTIPFYVAAPTSTLDFGLSTGEAIPIEERDPNEVLCIEGIEMGPVGSNAWNPSFDVTPAELISAIITEKGIAFPPYSHSLRALT